MSRRRVCLVAALVSGLAELFLSTCVAANLPSGMAFVGLNSDQSWHLYTVAEAGGNFVPMETSSEPRTPAIHPTRALLAYVAADGVVHELDLTSRTDRAVIAPTEQHSYISPVYDRAGSLYVVVMQGRKSLDTDIVRLTQRNGQLETVVAQRSAQFEPALGPAESLFYSSVSCAEDCGGFIQEIWGYSLTGRSARQLTLLNAASHSPAPSPDGKWVYFSSNRRGSYHIWRVSAEGGEAEQITDGNVTDIDASPDPAGNLYFVRMTQGQGRLMRRSASGQIEEVALPDGVKAIRDLSVSLW